MSSSYKFGGETGHFLLRAHILFFHFFDSRLRDLFLFAKNPIFFKIIKINEKKCKFAKNLIKNKIFVVFEKNLWILEKIILTKIHFFKLENAKFEFRMIIYSKIHTLISKTKKIICFIIFIAILPFFLFFFIILKKLDS